MAASRMVITLETQLFTKGKRREIKKFAEQLVLSSTAQFALLEYMWLCLAWSIKYQHNKKKDIYQHYVFLLVMSSLMLGISHNSLANQPKMASVYEHIYHI